MEGKQGRCLVRRKCATCRHQTEHAFLRDGDRYADVADEGHYQYEAWQAAHEMQEFLEACEIEVRWQDTSHYTDGTPWSDVVAGWLVQYLADGTFRLRLSRSEGPVRNLAVMTYVWERLATGALLSYDVEWHVFSGSPDSDTYPRRLLPVQLARTVGR